MIFWFTGLAIAAVGKTAGEVVREVRRQFKENPGIMEYKQKPDYRACVSLVTEVSESSDRTWLFCLCEHSMRYKLISWRE